MVSGKPEHLVGVTEPTKHELDLQTDPDANFDPSRRSTMLRHTEEEVGRLGSAGTESCATSLFSFAQGDLVKARIMKNYMHKDDSLAKLSMFNAFSPAYWARRAEVSKDVSHTRQGDGSLRALANAEGPLSEGIKQM
jgi:hypothetical protein